MLVIREAKEADQESIISIISLAFKDEQEIRDGEIVQSLLYKELLKDNDHIVSLVAEEETIVGHVLVSPVSLLPDKNLFFGQVSPLSVHPNFQSKGVGSSLMEAVIEKSKVCGLHGLFLLGDPNFYSRFGFSPSEIKSAYGPSIYFQELIFDENISGLDSFSVNLAAAFLRLEL